MKHVNVKHTLVGLICVTMLGASLAACGGSGAKATLPGYTGPPTPSTTVATAPTTTAPTATGPVALVEHSAYTYGGLKFIVNLPADIPITAVPKVRLFSEFLQGVGRTTAENRLDPSVSGLASASVVKYVQASIQPATARTIGSMVFTVTKVKSGSAGFALITGCVDQSKVVQVLKDGSHIVDAGTKKYPTLKMTAQVNPGSMGAKVVGFSFAAESC